MSGKDPGTYQWLSGPGDTSAHAKSPWYDHAVCGGYIHPDAWVAHEKVPRCKTCGNFISAGVGFS